MIWLTGKILYGCGIPDDKRLRMPPLGLVVDLQALETGKCEGNKTRLHFGTGGIRAVMGPDDNQLNGATVAAISQAVAGWLRDGWDHPKVVIARDCRENGSFFVRVVAEVLAGNGVRVVLLPDIQPTPVLSYAIRALSCTAGIVITASHNAREYNGYKVYDNRGCQATDAVTQAIQAKLEKGELVRRASVAEAQSSGMIRVVNEGVLEGYIEAALASIPLVSSGPEGLRVVYTPLNGTGYAYVPRMLSRMGVEQVQLVPQQALPNGTFPTCPLPNPENAAALQLGMRLCTESGAELLLANDPDADRVGVAACQGGSCRRLTGDEVALLLFDWICQISARQGVVPGNRLAYTTVVTTPLLDEVARRWGVELRRTLTGFKYIGDQLCQLVAAGDSERFLLGMEESCGYLLGSYVRDKDGMAGAAAVAQMASWRKARGRTLTQALDELYATYGWCASAQVSVHQNCGSTESLMVSLREYVPAQMSGLAVVSTTDYLKGVPMPSTSRGGDSPLPLLPCSDVLEFELEGGSKVIVRPSGTEPKLKAYVFARGESRGTAFELLERLEADVRSLLLRAN